MTALVLRHGRFILPPSPRCRLAPIGAFRPVLAFARRLPSAGFSKIRVLGASGRGVTSAMPNVAVIGGQWGDEGKGKVVDAISHRFDVVARFQGGPNAGHTVTVGGKRHALHHIPSGVFRPRVRNVVGNGTVLDLPALHDEIRGLAAEGIDLDGRLFISNRAHVILPFTKRMDAAAESSAGQQKIGTTLRGIGPTYELKASRTGIRIADLEDRDALLALVSQLLRGPVGHALRAAGVDPGSPEDIAVAAFLAGRQLAPYVADVSALLNDWIDQGSQVLFEGAQGTLLDLDHGFYPYVTSSTTISGGVCGGLGVAPSRVHAVIGVFKAYCTRVGGGPMPTELDDGPAGIGQRIRTRGSEYGTTTGRPRRCGWFDGVVAGYSNRLNRFNNVAVTLLDVLDPFEEIRICVGYRLDGEETKTVPASASVASRIEPVYETVPGWCSDTTGIRAWGDLPPRARDYLKRLSECIGAEIGMVSVGPDRDQRIVKPGSWLADLLGA